MSIVRIPEVVVPGKRLGRHVDKRTAGARAAGGPPPMAARVVSVKHASSGLPLDQGDTSACTGNALVGCLNSAPHWKSGQPTLNEADALKVYSAEGQLDGNGPYPPNDDGGTGQYVCEAAIQMGWCSDFDVAADAREALLALVLRPVITGINWMTSFDEPDENGLVSIAPGATVRGGHEIVAVGIDAAGELVEFWNSWGTSWGVGGRFFMSFSTWGKLLGQGGDVTVPRTRMGWVAQP